LPRPVASGRLRGGDRRLSIDRSAASPSRDGPGPRVVLKQLVASVRIGAVMPMPPGRRDIHRIRLAPSADAADCRQALLVGVKSAIGRAAEPAVVISAPWTIGVSRLADRSRHDQSAEKAEREFHRLSFRITLSRATFHRQLSSSVAGCKCFTHQFYLAACSESVGLQRAPNHAAPKSEIPIGGRLISNYGKGAGRCQQRTHQQRYGPQRRIVPGVQ